MARSGKTTKSELTDLALKVLAEVVIDAFVLDVVELVRLTVKAAKDDAENHPERYDGDWVKARWDSFCRWEKSKQPLDYGPHRETFPLLVRALSRSEEDPIHGLPQGNVKSISIGDLARSIHDICRRAEVRQMIRPPVWRDGVLPAVARMAIANAHSRMGPSLSEEDKRSQIVKFVSEALIERNVHFFPNGPDNGHPTPSTSTWTYLGNRPSPADRANNQLETVGERRLRLCDDQALLASQADVHGPWSILECNIESFANYMGHDCLPDEWGYATDTSISGNDLVRPVYEWAAQRLKNPNLDWRTRLAVTLAFLVSKLTPDVFCPDSSKTKEFPILKTVLADLRTIRPSTRKQSINILRQLPWVEKPGRRGVSLRQLYFTQASVVILAWIDPKSAIRKELALRQNKNPLISIFNSKHSQWSFQLFTCVAR